MDLQEVGYGYVLDRTGSGQGQVACTCDYGKNLRVPSNAEIS